MALAFNDRLLTARVESPVMLAAKPTTYFPDRPLSTEAYVAIDDGVARGGFLLQWRDFWRGGKSHRVETLDDVARHLVMRARR
jgi:hypothetical protein